MDRLVELYKELETYLDKPVYRICPKCSDNHEGNCRHCAWQFCRKPCTTYGLWDDGNWPADKCQIIEVTLTWEWFPDFVKHLNTKTFLTKEDALSKTMGKIPFFENKA